MLPGDAKAGELHYIGNGSRSFAGRLPIPYRCCRSGIATTLTLLVMTVSFTAGRLSLRAGRPSAGVQLANSARTIWCFVGRMQP